MRKSLVLKRLVSMIFVSFLVLPMCAGSSTPTPSLPKEGNGRIVNGERQHPRTTSACRADTLKNSSEEKAAYTHAAQEAKRNPDQAIALLKAGNERFVAGHSIHPHSDAARLRQAGTENQGNHAYATVITCSDSRVPVERVFDVGVMDLFLIRVAGNVCDTDEVGSIEYGLSHVNTPVLVVLGHTQCGAVTAVTHAVHGTGHALERNIPPLVDNIQPAVERAIAEHHDIHGDAIIPYAIEENVWQGIEDLYLTSPSTRELVKSGKAKVVGAIYDVGTGKVTWLPESKTGQILAQVEQNPNRALNAMADSGHGDSHGTNTSVTTEHVPAHGVNHGGGHAKAIVKAEAITLIEPSRLQELDANRHRNVETLHVSLVPETDMQFIYSVIGILVLAALTGGIGWQSGFFQKLGIAGRLYTSFGVIVLLAVLTGLEGYHFLGRINDKAKLESAAFDLDRMGDQAQTLQNEFLLYGIEDKSHGEACVSQLNELIQEFDDDLVAMQKLDLNSEDIREVEKIVSSMRHKRWRPSKPERVPLPRWLRLRPMP